MAVASEADVSPASDEESSLAADVLRLLPSAVTVLDEHGRFILINHAAARMKVEQSLRLAILEKRFCCASEARVSHAGRPAQVSRANVNSRGRGHRR
jgi:hypothetical protein